MSEIANRYRRVAGTFTARAQSVAPMAWNNPTPCAGWLARDIVRHMVEWMPPILREGAGITLPPGPPVDVDPAAAWVVMSDAIQQVLDSPALAESDFTHPQIGRMPLEEAIAMIIIGDVLVHTWDLARATGLDETLDPDEVARMASGMEAYDDALRTSGHYAPRVAVPDDAPAQAQLIAFMGRQP